MESLEKDCDINCDGSEVGNVDSSGASTGIEFDEDLLESITDKLHNDSSSIKSLTLDEKRYLDRIARSMQGKSGSSMLKLWAPYWQPIVDPLFQQDKIYGRKQTNVEGSKGRPAHGRIDVVRMHHLAEHMREISRDVCESSCNKTKCRSGDHTDESDLLGYQLVGGLLGYVTMMRTLSGGWAVHEQVDSILEEANASGDSNAKKTGETSASLPSNSPGEINGSDENKTDVEKAQWQEEVRAYLAHLHFDESGPEESITGDEKSLINVPPSSCLELLLQSSPFLSPSFRPRTLSEAVAAWVSSAPPSLTRRLKSHSHGVSFGTMESDGAGGSATSVRGGALRDAVRTLLIDVCHILSSPYVALYAMLDMWMLGYIVNNDNESETDGTISDLEKSLAAIACWPPEPSQPLAAVVLPLITHFKSNVFGVRSKLKKRNVPTAELFTRKAFLLFTHFLDRQYTAVEHADETDSTNIIREVSAREWNESLVLELNWYISNYCNN